MGDPPLLTIVPPVVAVVLATKVAALVVTEAFCPSVVKETCDP